MLEECTPTTKSSETQFSKPFSASEIIPKQTKFATKGYEFSLRSFWQVMEPKRSSYGQGTVVLRIYLKWISATRDIVNPASRVTCRAHEPFCATRNGLLFSNSTNVM